MPRRKKRDPTLMERLQGSLKLTRAALAKQIKVPLRHLAEMLNGKQPMSVETANFLTRHLGNSPEFWASMQTTAGMVRHSPGIVVSMVADLGSSPPPPRPAKRRKKRRRKPRATAKRR